MFDGFGCKYNLSIFVVEDPFQNDPFFKGMGGGSMFGRMDQMMNEMKSNMRDPISMMGDMDELRGGGARFQSFTNQTSMKMGPDGRPVKESYQKNTKGAIGQTDH